jgi:hypothetical protein
MIQKYENIIDQIAEKSYGVIDDFLNEAEIKAINQALESRYLENKFKNKRIGNAEDTQRERFSDIKRNLDRSDYESKSKPVVKELVSKYEKNSKRRL